MAAIEIACDESGFSGSNLADPDDRVFTHASVDVPASLAGELVGEARARFPGTAAEYKSRNLQPPAAGWLLDHAGPLAGRAHVHLIDKTFFTVRRLVDLLAGEPGYASGTSLDPDPRAAGLAVVLHRRAPRTYGAAVWQDVLQAFVTMLRSRRQWLAGTHVGAFFRALDALPRGELDEIMDLLRRGRPRLEALRTRLVDDPELPPVLEPLVPAVLETARHWSAGGCPVTIVHDEQSALTRTRIDRIQRLLDGRLLDVRRVDSRDDARVQLADLVAGSARRIATAGLRGEGGDPADRELTALLRPYVDRHSIWDSWNTG